MVSKERKQSKTPSSTAPTSRRSPSRRRCWSAPPVSLNSESWPRPRARLLALQCSVWRNPAGGDARGQPARCDGGVLRVRMIAICHQLRTPRIAQRREIPRSLARVPLAARRRFGRSRITIEAQSWRPTAGNLKGIHLVLRAFLPGMIVRGSGPSSICPRAGAGPPRRRSRPIAAPSGKLKASPRPSSKNTSPASPPSP